MPSIAHSEAVVPKQLPAREKSALVDALYAVQSEVFDGVDRESFVKYVVDSKAQRTQILLHKDAEGRIVGYFALHFFEKRVMGEPATIARAEAGTLRAYRGRNSNSTWGAKQGLARIVKNPKKPLYYLGSLVHPSSYSLFAKYFDTVWPSAQEEVPAEIAAVMCELGDEFGLEVVDPRNPLVRKVGWKTRDTEAERNYWRHCEKPGPRFFVAANPTYAEGHGLLTLVPVSPSRMLRMAGRVAQVKLDTQIDAALVMAQRLPIGARLLRPAEVRKRLHASPLFRSLDDASLSAITSTAEIVSLPAGTMLFREGEPGQDMYLLARGAAYVLSGPRDEEVVIDELDAGAIFGEIAMLTGSTRTASIRTATPSILVRIRREALMPLLEREPRLREAVWHALAARLFDDFIRTSSRYPGLDRAARLAWIARGRHRELAPGERFTTDREAFVFVVSGSIEINPGGAWVVTPAPGLVEVTSPLDVVARSKARVVSVPRLDAASPRAAEPANASAQRT